MVGKINAQESSKNQLAGDRFACAGLGPGKQLMPRSVSLSFELLQTFVSLIRHEGDAAAVMRELELIQPTLSKRLKYLQHAGPMLDRPWLVREGKTWKLTDEGRKVWPAVEELVDRYRNLHTFVEEGGKPAGAAPVHFACGQQMAAGLVRQRVTRIPQETPRRPTAHLDVARSCPDRRRLQRLPRPGHRHARRAQHPRDRPPPAAHRAAGDLPARRSSAPPGPSGNRSCGRFPKPAPLPKRSVLSP